MASVGESDVESLKNFCKMISESLGPSLTLKLGSLIEDFDKQRISLSELRNSVRLLFDETGHKYEGDDTDLEEGEIREDRLPLRDEQAESNRLEGLKSGTDVEVRVSEERELEKHVTNGFNKMNSEGKKKRILQPEPIERSPKRRRTSRRLHGVTPTYKLMTEEEQCPLKNKVLNNERLLKQLDDPSGHKTLTNYEEAVARYEDDMYEANLLMEALKSAMEEAEKVMREEMSVEDLGVMFYTCIEMQYCEYYEDIFEALRQDHKKALPAILRRLKQRLNELTVVRKTLMSAWKQALKENAAKQRDSTAIMVAKCTRICAVIDTAELSPSEIRTLVSLIEDFNKFRIGHSEFSSSVQRLLFKRKHLPRGDPKTYTTESDRLAVRAKVDKKTKAYPIPHGKRESEKHVTNLEGKKRRILHSEPVERTPKIPRESELLDQVTPNYTLIPEEERDKVSDDPVLKCLNNTCVLSVLTRVDVPWGHRKLTCYEEAMAECEDDMFKRDREIGVLTSAVDSAKKVLEEEMSVEDLGVMFYRCIQKLCRRDMYEVVRQDHKQVLPQILTKLKKKLSMLTSARERKKPGWKKTFEVNTAKQRELNAQILRKKQKANQQI